MHISDRTKECCLPHRIILCKLDDKSNHESHEKQEAGSATDFSDQFSESIQLELQWRVLGICS